jgi:hypothetical protein
VIDIASVLRPSVASWNCHRNSDFPAELLLFLPHILSFKTLTQMFAEHLKLGHGQFLSYAFQLITSTPFDAIDGALSTALNKLQINKLIIDYV